MSQSVKSTLAGVFELSIFVKDFTRFFAADKAAALRSFIWPAIAYPLIASTFLKIHPADGYISLTLLMHALFSWGALGAFYGTIYFISKSFGRNEHFWQTVNILNSASIITFFLMLPVFASVLIMGNELSSIMNYWAFVIVAGMAYDAFILAKGLRLNLFLGCSLTSIGLFFSNAGTQLMLDYLKHFVNAA